MKLKVCTFKWVIGSRRCCGILSPAICSIPYLEFLVGVGCVCACARSCVRMYACETSHSWYVAALALSRKL